MAVACVVACAVGGCTADPTPLNPGDGTIGPGPFFADTVVAFRTGDIEPVTCTDVARKCPAAQAGGECTDGAPSRALGMQDGTFFTIGPNSSIDLAFICSIGIRETGPNGAGTASDDFIVHATVDTGALPVVQVSDDGTNYESIKSWPRQSLNGPYKPDAGFPLEAIQITQTRFVRIAETSGKGSIQLDAVEALAVLTAKQ